VKCRLRTKQFQAKNIAAKLSNQNKMKVSNLFSESFQHGLQLSPEEWAQYFLQQKKTLQMAKLRDGHTTQYIWYISPGVRQFGGATNVS
jgi:hypothetical protein